MIAGSERPLVSPTGRLGAVALAALAACTPRTATTPSTLEARAAACPTQLQQLVPSGATRWVITRPRALFEHPRIGPLLGRAFDDAGDQALFDRARRVGYDARTVERALLAWTARSSLSVGVGALDTRRIESLLWERLLPPRDRSEERGVLRMLGTLGDTTSSLAVWTPCSLVAYAEGPGRMPLQLTEHVLTAHESPDERGDDAREPLVWWHADTVPAELGARAPTALLEGVRGVDVRADATERGVSLRVSLAGTLPADAAARARRALDGFANDTLGTSIGAPQWLRADRVRVDVTSGALEGRVEVPWAALDAMADVLRGRVSAAP